MNTYISGFVASSAAGYIACVAANHLLGWGTSQQWILVFAACGAVGSLLGMRLCSKWVSHLQARSKSDLAKGTGAVD
jgi:hypothetical protein